MTTRTAARRWLLALLLTAGLARLGLALLGGQLYYGDELRYYRGAFATYVLAHDGPGKLAQFGNSAAHPGFALLAGVLQPLHQALAGLGAPEAADPFARLWHTPHLAAALLGLFSTLNLWLIYLLARRTGAERDEALWGALLAAASLTLLVYARHLLPYDASLTFLLVSALLGLGRVTPLRAGLSGAAAAFGLAVYNGHWLLVPIVAGAVAWRQRRAPEVVRLGSAWLAGAALGLLGGYVPAFALGDGTFFTGIGTFAGSIRDGDFAEGWSLPWEFLWHAEGPLGAAVALLALGALAAPAGSARSRRWLLVALAIYAGLVIASVGLGKFVVYARTSRPLVIPLCLAAAAGLAAFLTRRPRLRWPIAGAVVVGAAANFTPVFLQPYPVELDREINRRVGVPVDYLTFLDSWDKREHPPVTRPDLVRVNTYALFGFTSHRPYPEGEVLLDLPHPLALRFYQYDGHTPAQRALLRQHEPRMKLIRWSKPPPAR